MLKRIHHINFLVADLDKAVERYKKLFELESVVIEALPERGVKTARFELDGVWIVLVQPVDEDSQPAQRLRQQGEGAFLVSFAVDDLHGASEKLVANGAMSPSAMARDGLHGWRVIDLDADAVFGASLQLTEETGEISAT